MFFLFINQVKKGPVGSLEKDEATLANYFIPSLQRNSTKSDSVSEKLRKNLRNITSSLLFKVLLLNKNL